MLFKKKGGPGGVDRRKKQRRKPGDQRFPGRLVDVKASFPRKKSDRRKKDRRKG